jgi:acyl-CoA synthetase (AMP-forming)/AMP-acid ligase II
MNLASHLDRWAVGAPLKTALRTAEAELTYTELNLWSGGIAAQLAALGLAGGDRVAVLGGSNAELVAALYGTWKLGAIAVLLNPQLAPGELEGQVRHAGATVIVVDGDPARWAAATGVAGRAAGIRVVRAAGPALAAIPAADLDSGALAVIAYTSGTTGTAKGVAHTHEAMATQVEMVGEHYPATPGDEILTLLPLYLLSIFVVGPMLAVSVGASCRIMARYDARAVVRSIEQDRTTIAAAVPLFFHDLRELASGNGAGHDLSSLRVISSGGAPLEESLRDDLEGRFGFRILQLYGMTEAPAIVTSDPMAGVRKKGSVGRALAHIRVTIVDDEGRELPPGAIGEVCAAPVDDGPFAGRYQAMTCYWGNAGQTAEALAGGRLHTGDVGYLDEEGYLYLVGRKKDIIIRGGMNIYPREIEAVLAADARVDECVVAGAPHVRYGEVPVAYVRLQPGAEATAGELLAIANRRLPSSQRLQAVHVVRDFPRNSLGKVLRREFAHGNSLQERADE